MPSIPISNASALPVPPAASSRHGKGLFWILLTRVVLLGAAADFLMLALFVATPSPIQAWLSVGGITAYLISYCLLRQRRNRLAIALLWTEIFIHATAGTVISGWDSGFHYYLLMFAPIIIMSTSRHRTLWMLTALWLVYLGLLFTTQTLRPMEPVGHLPLLLLQALNASTLFINATYFTFIYRQSANAAARKLELLATTDPLTGLFNRRFANEMIAREAKHVERGSRSLSFILADIDHFKAINDRHGHDGGDAVLVAVSKALGGITRAENILSRWGGEEFLLVLPATSRQGAASLAFRIQEIMQDFRLPVGEAEVQVTLTMGIACLEPGESWSAALARADRALYEGKRSGRNCVRLDRDLPVATMEADPAQAA